MNSQFEWMRKKIQHFDQKRYWKYREYVINKSKGFFPMKVFRLLYIKRCDAFSNASLGTHINYGAYFASCPQFPHGLYGIIVSHNAIIGSNCRIFHQVTIGEGRGGLQLLEIIVYLVLVQRLLVELELAIMLA